MRDVYVVDQDEKWEKWATNVPSGLMNELRSSGVLRHYKQSEVLRWCIMEQLPNILQRFKDPDDLFCKHLEYKKRQYKVKMAHELKKEYNSRLFLLDRMGKEFNNFFKASKSKEEFIGLIEKYIDLVKQYQGSDAVVAGLLIMKQRLYDSTFDLKLIEELFNINIRSHMTKSRSKEDDRTEQEYYSSYDAELDWEIGER